MKVKKNLSIEDDILKIAEDRAKSLHLSFAAYIVTLLNRDLQLTNNSEVIWFRKPEEKREPKIDDMAMDAAEAIMNMA